MKIDDIKKLREETGAGIADCKEALKESNGDMAKAKGWLKQRGVMIASNKTSRPTGAGIVDTYIHHTLNSGATVVMGTETDFVARNPEFKEFAHDIAQQVTASGTQQVENLLKEPWIKDDTKSIGDLLNEKIAKFGENITIQEVKRFEVK
ncbi:translation elongation factor Ts [Candidatus Daviesbacteria bacterium]|nr:translation elongation factor Ts [Candidatus Daviesbacteria bacterium]